MAGHSPCILKLINAPDDMRFSCAIFIPALDGDISYIHAGRFYCIGVAVIRRYLHTVGWLRLLTPSVWRLRGNLSMVSGFEWDGKTYGKDSEEVVHASRMLHRELNNGIDDRMMEIGMKKSDLTRSIGADAPMTYRALDEKMNITFTTVVRLAKAIGCEVHITLTPIDSHDGK